MTVFTCFADRTFYFGWEVSLMEWLQAHMGSPGLYASAFFSTFGEEMVLVAMLGLLYWCLDKEFGRRVGVTFLFASALNPILKNIFLRRRPYCDNPSIKCLRPVAKGADINNLAAQGYSFPSGHSTNTVSMFSSMAVFGKNRWLTVIGIFIPLMCGISRICLGVHYPTDVLCGWLLGLFAILVVSFLERTVKSRYAFYAILLTLTVPGWFYCKSNDYYTSFGLLAGFFAAEVFEKKYVKFENTRSPLRCIFRLGGGIAIFFAATWLTKLPFDSEFLKQGTLAAHFVRSVRYFVVIFVDLALYPMLFAPVDRLLKKR